MGGDKGVTSMSPRRRPMISSVSVVRAWERQVSHTSSLILTEVSDISAAGRGRRRSAGVSGGRWLVGAAVQPLLSSLVCSNVSGDGLRRVGCRGLCCVSLRTWARDTLSGVGPRIRCGAARSARPRAGSSEPGDCW